MADFNSWINSQNVICAPHLFITKCYDAACLVLRAAKWMNEWSIGMESCLVSLKTREKDQQCLKKTDMFLFFILHWKKSVDTEKHSHSWELRLITVDVRWALGSTVMGWKWVIIVLSSNSGQKRPCETSHLPEIQRCLNTHTQPLRRRTAVAGGNNSILTGEYFCVSMASEKWTWH